MAYREIPLPIQGVNYGLPVDKSQQATSGYMNNVRPVDTLEKRIRLGQRPGQDKWSATQVGGATAPIVCVCVVAVMD